MEAYCKIPTELCQWVLANKYTQPFRVYLQLKAITDSIFILENDIVDQLTTELKYRSSRAVRNNIEILVHDDFVGYDSRTNKYFVRGFDYLRRSLKIYRRSAVIMYYEDNENLKGFLIGAVVTQLIAAQKRKERGLGRIPGRSSRKPRSFYPVANAALSKILKISLSTASAYKRLAEQNDFIQIQKNAIGLGIPSSQINNYDNLLYSPDVKTISKYILKEDGWKDYIKEYFYICIGKCKESFEEITKNIPDSLGFTPELKENLYNFLFSDYRNKLVIQDFYSRL